jgi:PIN domain nuclease of toxin-antitoxin system
VLLDTCIWLWLLPDLQRLGPQTLQLSQDTKNELWLSALSTWEAIILNFKGRMQRKGNLADRLAQAAGGAQEVPVPLEIALLARQLSPHQVPADCILAAATHVLDLTLVTADDRHLALGNMKTLAIRQNSPA